MNAGGRKETLLAALVLFVAIAGVFGQTLQHGYHQSEAETVQHNPLFHRGSGVEPSALAGPRLVQQQVPGATAPTALVSIAVDRFLWRGKASGLHLTQLVLHFGVSLLFFLGLRRHFDSQRLCVALAVAFAIHPLAAEPVSGLNFRGDLLAALGTLGALGLVFRARAATHQRSKLTAYALAFGVLLLGCLSKETAYVAPFLLVVLDATPSGNGLRRGQITGWMVLAGAVSVGLAWRTFVTGGFLTLGPGVVVTNAGLVSRLGNGLWGLWAGILKSVVPTGLAPAYSVRIFDDWREYLLASALGFALLGLAATVIVFRKRQPLVLAGLAFALSASVPTLGFIALPTLQADRFLYLPLLGILGAIGALLSGEGAQRVWRRIASWAPAWRNPLPGMGAVALGFFAWQAHNQASVWKTDASLWNHAVNVSPNAARAWTGLAWVELGGNRMVAKRAAATAVEIEKSPETYEAMGHANMADGNAFFACQNFESALKLSPNPPSSRLLQKAGLCLRSTNDTVAASALLKRAVSISPWLF